MSDIYTVEYDGFRGEIIGHYTTREGKKGVVMQQIGTKVVHVYNEQRVVKEPQSETQKTIKEIVDE